MEMLEKNIRPLDIMTEKAILNALTVDMALGCSTNSMLHLPAIAHEAGVDIDLDIANEIAEILKESKLFKKVEACPPRFLNMDVSDEFLCQYINKMNCPSEQKVQLLDAVIQSVSIEKAGAQTF